MREITQENVEIAEDAVNSFCKKSLTRNQYNALVSFVFNVGRGAFEKSTLLKRVNEGDFEKAAKSFFGGIGQVEKL